MVFDIPLIGNGCPVKGSMVLVHQPLHFWSPQLVISFPFDNLVLVGCVGLCFLTLNPMLLAKLIECC
jgi:hypothetical protein